MEKRYREVARTMARMHLINIDDVEPGIWATLEHNISLLPERLKDCHKQDRLDKVTPLFSQTQ